MLIYDLAVPIMIEYHEIPLNEPSCTYSSIVPLTGNMCMERPHPLKTLCGQLSEVT